MPSQPMALLIVHGAPDYDVLWNGKTLNRDPRAPRATFVIIPPPLNSSLTNHLILHEHAVRSDIPDFPFVYWGPLPQIAQYYAVISILDTLKIAVCFLLALAILNLQRASSAPYQILLAIALVIEAFDILTNSLLMHRSLFTFLSTHMDLIRLCGSGVWITFTIALWKRPSNAFSSVVVTLLACGLLLPLLKDAIALLLKTDLFSRFYTLQAYLTHSVWSGAKYVYPLAYLWATVTKTRSALILAGSSLLGLLGYHFWPLNIVLFVAADAWLASRKDGPITAPNFT